MVDKPSLFSTRKLKPQRKWHSGTLKLLSIEWNAKAASPEDYSALNAAKQSCSWVHYLHDDLRSRPSEEE
jgi:hypothetical protein